MTRGVEMVERSQTLQLGSAKPDLCQPLICVAVQLYFLFLHHLATIDIILQASSFTFAREFRMDCCSDSNFTEKPDGMISWSKLDTVMDVEIYQQSLFKRCVFAGVRLCVFCDPTLKDFFRCPSSPSSEVCTMEGLEFEVIAYFAP